MLWKCGNTVYCMLNREYSILNIVYCIQDTEYRIQNNPSKERWSQMIPDDPRWSKARSQMIPDKIISDDPRWSQTLSGMIPDDPKKYCIMHTEYRIQHTEYWILNTRCRLHNTAAQPSPASPASQPNPTRFCIFTKRRVRGKPSRESKENNKSVKPKRKV